MDPSATEPLSLDEIDKAILKELQEDGRMSYSDLGPKVGLSAPAARQRVQRLIAGDVLNVVGITNPLRLGLPVMAMLGIRAEGDLRVLADQLRARPEVIYIVFTAGTFDLLVEVVCQTPREMLELVNDGIGKFEGVEHVEKMMYLDIHTHRFNWGVP